jgi:hypothetical protein
MIKLLAQLFSLAIVISFCSFAAMAQTKQTKKISRGERLITAFANSKTLPFLFRDDEGVFAEGPQGISPDVIRILKLGKQAIPLLIRHLDDKRVFKTMESCCFGDQSVKKVSVSDGVFFILVNIIHETSPIFDVKCLKQDRQFEENNYDCIREKYFSGRNMKRNWLKVYRAGKIHYKKFEY